MEKFSQENPFLNQTEEDEKSPEGQKGSSNSSVEDSNEMDENFHEGEKNREDTKEKEDVYARQEPETVLLDGISYDSERQSLKKYLKEKELEFQNAIDLAQNPEVKNTLREKMSEEIEGILKIKEEEMKRKYGAENEEGMKRLIGEFSEKTSREDEKGLEVSENEEDIDSVQEFESLISDYKEILFQNTDLERQILENGLNADQEEFDSLRNTLFKFTRDSEEEPHLIESEEEEEGKEKKQMSRRTFLKFLGGAVAYASLAPNSALGEMAEKGVRENEQTEQKELTEREKQINLHESIYKVNKEFKKSYGDFTEGGEDVGINILQGIYKVLESKNEEFKKMGMKDPFPENMYSMIEDFSKDLEDASDEEKIIKIYEKNINFFAEEAGYLFNIFAKEGGKLDIFEEAKTEKVNLRNQEAMEELFGEEIANREYDIYVIDNPDIPVIGTSYCGVSFINENQIDTNSQYFSNLYENKYLSNFTDEESLKNYVINNELTHEILHEDYDYFLNIEDKDWKDFNERHKDLPNTDSTKTFEAISDVSSFISDPGTGVSMNVVEIMRNNLTNPLREISKKLEVKYKETFEEKHYDFSKSFFKKTMEEVLGEDLLNSYTSESVTKDFDRINNLIGEEELEKIKEKYLKFGKDLMEEIEKKKEEKSD